MSFFIVPLTGVGTRADPRRPKYISTLGVSWALVDFATSAICWANTDSTQAASVAANSDAIAIPPLDTIIDAAALPAVQGDVSAFGLPVGWVAAGMTHRDVVRVLISMAQLCHRIQAKGGTFVSSATVDSQITALDSTDQQLLAACVSESGIAGVTVSGTLGDTLLSFGQAFFTQRGVVLGDL